MVYTFKENIIPLNLIFSELKKEQNKYYANLKGILEKLSLDETLSNSVNNYYYLRDKSKFLASIRYERNTLESFLIK